MRSSRLNENSSEYRDETQAELDILDGATITTAELNLLDNVVASATLSVAAEATESITVSIQLKDAAGEAMTTASYVMVYLSADSAGATAASAADLTISGGTDGLTIPIADSNTALAALCYSEADGDIDVVITDAGGGTLTNYMHVVLPSGKLGGSSAAITFS